MNTSKILILITLLFTSVNTIAQDCPKDFIEELSYNTAAGGTVNSFQPALEIHACKQNYRGSTGQNIFWSVKGLFFHYKKVQFTKKYVLTCGNIITKRVVLFDLKVGDRRTGSTFSGDMDLADGFFKTDCDADDLNRIKSVSVSNVTCILADDEPMVIEEKARLKKLADEKKKKLSDNDKLPTKKTIVKPALSDDEKLNEAMMKNLEKDFDKNKNKKVEPDAMSHSMGNAKNNNTTISSSIKKVSQPIYAYVMYNFYPNTYYSDVIDVTLLDSSKIEIKSSKGVEMPRLHIYANRAKLWFDKIFIKDRSNVGKVINFFAIYFTDSPDTNDCFLCSFFHYVAPPKHGSEACYCHDKIKMEGIRRKSINECKRKTTDGGVFELH